MALQSPKFDDNIYDRVPGSENEQADVVGRAIGVVI